jgi:DNA-binding GntR family transcriptional regulator
MPAKRAIVQQPVSLPEMAYAYLREEILSRNVDFGTALRQEQIAEDLKMSRLPVREAMMRLEVEGLVTLRPRRGYVVSSLDRQEIEDIFETRALLEEHAGYVATSRRNHQDIAELSTLLVELEQVSSQERVDTSEYGARNQAFHDRLFAASRRKQLCRIMSILRDNVERYVRISVAVAPHLQEASAEHRAIFAAFAEGHADEVARLCRQHCERTCRRLLDNLSDHTKKG